MRTITVRTHLEPDCVQITKNYTEDLLLLNCATKVVFFLELTKCFVHFFKEKMHFVCN